MEVRTFLATIVALASEDTGLHTVDLRVAFFTAVEASTHLPWLFTISRHVTLCRAVSKIIAVAGS